MGYQRLIDANLTRAFNKVKDLARDASVAKQKNIEYDFGTGEKTSVIENILFKVIIISSRRDSENKQSEETQIMFKKESVGELTQNDKVTIDGNVYVVGASVKSDGFISIVNLYREV